MKLRKKKTKKAVAPVDAPPEQDEFALPAEVDSRLSRLYDMIGDLESRVEGLPQELDVMLHLRKNRMIEECNPYSPALESELLTRIYEFLKDGPIWEVKHVPEPRCNHMDTGTLSKLYSEGWRFVMRVYPSDKSDVPVQVFHRPKLPATSAEFEALYKTFRAKRSPQGEKTSKPRDAKSKVLKAKRKSKTK